MSENGYATKDALREVANRPRRYADVVIAGWGRIQLQSITAGQFCRIDAAKNRAIMLASQGKIKEQAAAIQDHFIEVVKAVSANPTFTDSDREYLLALDAPIAERIKEACLEHLSGDDMSVEDAEKNLPAMSGGNSPSDSGAM